MAPKTKGRDHNPSGLGRAIQNRKMKDARKFIESGMYTTDLDSASRLKSVTQERDLDEFFSTAQLAETDFAAERRNVKIIPQSTNLSQNPYLLSEQEEKKTLQKHHENKQRLRVPRRPPWTKSMTTPELERQEKAAFLEWRRGLAVLQEEEKFLLTPFERNLEVWRQLWRVLERSHLIVQIVDARNPLRFRCEDLEDYVRDVEGPEGEKGTGKGLRQSLLLINKADLLSANQRLQWANYFDSQSVRYAFFSAANASALQQARSEALASDEPEQMPEDEAESPASSPVSDEEEVETSSGVDEDLSEEESDTSDDFYSVDEDAEDEETTQDPRIRVLSVLELEQLFTEMAPDRSAFADTSGNVPTKTVVGLVGYPNVGKSSTINALLGEKKVSVSSTPGKTKHFQTIHLSDSTILCDCPGLVFPQFATTKAELVCDGVLPIDQMKEYTGPISLVVQRIPKEVLEGTYGLSIQVKGAEEGGDGHMRAENLLVAYAIARGYMRSGQGNPDEARAARYILKDYVNAKLLFCHPPPGVEPKLFNERTHQIQLRRVAGKKRAPVTRVGKSADTFVPTESPSHEQHAVREGQGTKSRALDQEFFDDQSIGVYAKGIHGGRGLEFSRPKSFPHQNAVTNDGVVVAPKHARMAAILANQPQDGSKKHKKPKRVKQRSGKGYD